jgi:hypothetical protein
MPLESSDPARRLRALFAALVVATRAQIKSTEKNNLGSRSVMSSKRPKDVRVY